MSVSILAIDDKTKERRRRASEYGAADFITKPVDFEFLTAQLRQLSAPSARWTL